MKRLIPLLAVCAVAFAQAPVNVSIGPPAQGYTQMISYTGTDPEYIGIAPSAVQRYRITVTTASNAAACVITAASHGLQNDNAVTISGFTGGWAGANGTHKITVVDANSFSVPVNSAAFGPYGAQAPTVTSTAPRTNALIWSLQRIYYTAGGSVERTAYAGGSSGADKAWSLRTTYSYQ
jgi:hypothetical protein